MSVPAPYDTVQYKIIKVTEQPSFIKDALVLTGCLSGRLKKMKFATFNANSLRARLPILLHWLEREKPDVLCIQETKVQDKDFPVKPFEEAGYHTAFRGAKILQRQSPS